jgi:hypothetical protein
MGVEGQEVLLFASIPTRLLLVAKCPGVREGLGLRPPKLLKPSPPISTPARMRRHTGRMSHIEKVLILFLAVGFTTMSWVMFLTTVGISISTAWLPAVVLAISAYSAAVLALFVARDE